MAYMDTSPDTRPFQTEEKVEEKSPYQKKGKSRAN